jgi:hypothetical protein
MTRDILNRGWWKKGELFLESFFGVGVKLLKTLRGQK